MSRRSKSPPRHSEHVSDPSSPPDTVIPEPEPSRTNMEVHHHAHHAHGKKNWKSYGWEFLMLFLAVFCGFLAEYQLEHTIEKDREKKYIRSLVADLMLDSSEAQTWLTKNLARQNVNDTLLKLYGSDLSKTENSTKLYHYFLKSTGLPQFDPHTATLTQLKSSGSLRLIHSQKISDEVLNYDQQTAFLLKINAAYSEVYRDAWAAAFPVLHVNLYYDTRYADYDEKTIATDQFPPVNCSRENLDVFFGTLTRQQTYTKQVIGLLKKQIRMASELVKLLKEEYDLE